MNGSIEKKYENVTTDKIKKNARKLNSGVPAKLQGNKNSNGVIILGNNNP
jgi:hypothetical protein